ncbi:RES family NAD+ phosphorylase [Phycisphaerales bacterium AB-hyl4]|uniref:RES family NAD+ phosphorylase n=1 Tax=Natronomicrosphaera hydrolytica TaxID=3242702 RepID=A0ABV4U8J3_9BACT
MVESQHHYATRALVDSDAEQALLERMIEQVKPRKPAEPAFEQLHYLLHTPFRYPPLDYGSRFNTAFERSLWYGAEQLRTCLAEKAYYMLLFREGTEAKFDLVAREMTSFSVDVQTEAGIDLTLPVRNPSNGISLEKFAHSFNSKSGLISSVRAQRKYGLFQPLTLLNTFLRRP